MLFIWSIYGSLVPASDSTPDVQRKVGKAQRTFLGKNKKKQTKQKNPTDLDIGQHNKDGTET